MIELLNRLLAFIDAFLRKREQTKVQEQINEISENPYDFFNSHFGGSVQSNDAEEANKTDTGSNA